MLAVRVKMKHGGGSRSCRFEVAGRAANTPRPVFLLGYVGHKMWVKPLSPRSGVPCGYEFIR